MWFTFGSGHLVAELRAINRGLGGIARTLTRIERKQDLTMALVAIEQADLDAIAVTIVQVAEGLQAVLDSEEDLGPADKSSIEDALTKLKAVGPRVPTDAPPVTPPVGTETPAPGTPAENVPSEPVVTDPAAGDAVVTDPAAGDTVVTDPAEQPVDPNA